MLPAFIRNLLLSGLLLLVGFSSRASHLVGGELTYKWISCNTYKITVVLYGNCGETSLPAFSQLPFCTPEVCIYDGNTYTATVELHLDTPGFEVTPVCPDSLAYDACTLPLSTTPGIKKFIYSNTYTFLHTSAVWRMAYTGDNTPGSGTASGRAAAITNLLAPGGAEIQLVDTLNNSPTNTRGHNSSPVLTVEPIPFFCPNTESCYNPGAVDVYDTSVFDDQPSGDSLSFTLVPATLGNASCTVGGASGYNPAVYVCPGGALVSGSHPLSVVDCTPASFSFDPTNGQLCFNPITQRSVVVYNIEEFRDDTISDINTIAGTGAPTFGGDGFPAISAEINNPAGIRKDNRGNTYFADYGNNRVRKISPAGFISTIAGNGLFGYCGDGSAATTANLSRPIGVAIDTAGNVIFADNGNNVVRKINVTTGVITTVAGNGRPGFTGDGSGAVGSLNTYAGTGVPAFSGDLGLATSANIQNPAGICQDGLGNTYFSDYSNNRIRRVSAGGVITTVAGVGGPGGYSGDGGAATAAALDNPEGLWVAGSFLYFADYNNNVIRKVDLTAGVITTIAGTGVAGFGGDGGSASATTCLLNHPHSVFADAVGDVYLSDAGNNRIRKVDPFGTITTIAGNGTAGFAGDGSLASLPGVKINNPYGLFVDPSNNVYFADAGNNRIRYINSSGFIYTFAGNGTPAFSGDGGLATAASFNTPTDVFEDLLGDVFVADRSNNCIRKISICNGIITTIAGRGGTVGGYSGETLPPDSSKLSSPSFLCFNNNTQNTYISDFGNNRVRIITACELNHPTGVFVDQFNNIYISDTGNQRVRKVNASTGIISTITGNGTALFSGDGGPAIAAQVNNPYGLFVDGAENIYIADEGNNRIRKINPAGTISTAVGSGLASYGGDICVVSSPTVALNGPTDVSLDPAGNMFIADRGNNRIRKVDLNSIVTTVAGTGVAGPGGDGGPGILAMLNSPDFLCIDPLLNIYISDYSNNRIRKLDHSTTVNRVVVGTMQREMTFTVLSFCSYTSPIGLIDSVSGGTRLTATDSTEVYACQNSGDLVMGMNPTDQDTSLNITITASGLNTGFTFSVVNDNTPHPHGYVTVNTAIVTPGTYTFFITYTDNHCPLVGTGTQPFTVQILPVPTIDVSSVSIATCSALAGYSITPGGYGTPWTIKVSNSTYPFDTIQTFASDTGTFVDSLHPYPSPAGTYNITIYTSVSNLCAVTETITPIIPYTTIAASALSPAYCGANDYTGGGRIYLTGLPPGLDDTLLYTNNLGVWIRAPFVSSTVGTDTLFSLPAGTYDTIVVQQGICFDTVPRPLVLINPPFTMRTVTGKSPDKCGYCNGVDTLFGLHPDQFDTLTYRVSTLAGVITGRVSTPALIGADSFVIFSGLCSGIYDSFAVQTAGVNNCSVIWPGRDTLIAPSDTVDFVDTIHYGCSGDTIMFYNLSSAAPHDVLYYHWDFGDGTTDITANPMHIYTNATNDTANVTLTISNLKCVDTLSQQSIMNNYIHAGFTLSPDQFVCQLSPVTFANTSTGINPTYTWYFGDGDSDITINSVHSFTNSGTYTIKLVAEDNLIPAPIYYTKCYDTASRTLAVDSTSVIRIDATDSVICSGQAVTFTGVYAHIGDTGNVWTFGDGSSLENVNPVLHSYDGDTLFTISVTALYRVCAAQTTSRTIRVYSYPNIYLGPDTSICPGGAPLTLADVKNVANPKATWLWSNGETTATITVKAPGEYSAIETLDGCASYDTVIVLKDCYMDIPNVFTPNGDGTNDYFYPRQLLTKGLTTFKMDIYNRWGQLLYETTNIDGRGWDGSFNGTPQPEGVYVYLIEATFKDGQIEHHQGNVTLLK